VAVAPTLPLLHNARKDYTTTALYVVPRGAAPVIDNAVLRERMQAELDHLGLSGDDAVQIVQEINVLACLLIDAVLEGMPHGKAS
jgi:hypothetical protein